MSRQSTFKHEEADDSAGFLLWKITVLWQKKLSTVLDRFKITQTQYAILASLRWFEERNEPLKQSHLAEHTKIDKMTLSKAIRMLEKNGLVLRKKSVRDSRATDVFFTPQGKKITEKAIVAIEKADDEFFACLTIKTLIEYKTFTKVIISTNDSASN
ncbi:MAG: MarR family transcriptional regulator [bacterium]|nr:MarR family transcriptional regulator [bacterium]